jgi:hypothetical protein
LIWNFANQKGRKAEKQKSSEAEKQKNKQAEHHESTRAQEPKNRQAESRLQIRKLKIIILRFQFCDVDLEFCKTEAQQGKTPMAIARFDTGSSRFCSDFASTLFGFDLIMLTKSKKFSESLVVPGCKIEANVFAIEW